MINIASIADLSPLRESVSLDCKLAGGRDGKGALVLVVKEPAGFSFRNPGGLRVPAAQALQGGVSDVVWKVRWGFYPLPIRFAGVHTRPDAGGAWQHLP